MLANGLCRFGTITPVYSGGDVHGPFLPQMECECDGRCPRCSVEFELDVDFDRVTPERPENEKDLPLTVTSRDLVSNAIAHQIVSTNHRFKVKCVS
mmetsp:Transcript_25538/g.33972  ORF Transcript_25538/g.33972 Transcript_25538/m.33972 type:complete len:96 (-) Transcript_25538:842-1129(-)